MADRVVAKNFFL